MASRRAVARSKPAIAVFCSGQGTNLQAILDAVRLGKLAARVAVVISDRSDAKALKRARRAKADAYFVDPKAFKNREAYEHALIALCEAYQVQLICLAGFMRILSRSFVNRFRGSILNIHPALLPAFPGAHAVEDALAWGVRVSGVTVHLVDEKVDHGPILLQEAVPILARDTQKQLLERLHRVEHRLYPEAIKLMLERRVRISGRNVKVR